MNRFELAPPAAGAPPAVPAPAAVPVADEAAGTEALAAACGDLAALRAAMAGFEGCALKQGARNLVFADGDPRARVMVIGEAPGRDEDRAGLPFVGRSGQLLDRMLAAIGLSRRAEDPALGGLHHQRAALAAAAEPRPLGRRGGDAPAVPLPPHRARRRRRCCCCSARRRRGRCSAPSTGVTRLRGRWHDWRGVPVLATFHPAALLRDGTKKREAWADLLLLRARLDAGSGRCRH